MSKTEILWEDLTEKKQQEIRELLGDECNFDVFPIATIDFEEENDLQGQADDMEMEQ